MEKRDDKILLLSSIICLLPLVLSLILYPQLPEQVAVHWNSQGVADRYMHKAIAAFGLPFFFLAVNLTSNMFLLNDPKKAAQSQAIRSLIRWIIPATSVVIIPVTLFIAAGREIPIVMITTLFVGILLIVIGNYLPKSRQNYTVGIKLPWTLNDADNWNKTHRMAGFLWVIGGILVIISSFLSSEIWRSISLVVIIVLMLVLIPAIYSYSLYKRGKVEK